MTAKGTEQVGFSCWIARPQSIIALSALVLSCCGVFIAMYEASLIRRQQRASVWPHVEVAASLTRNRVEIWVRNSGVGPARIEAAALLEEGEMRIDWAEMMTGAGFERVPAYISWIGGGVLPRDSQHDAIFRIEAETGVDAPQAVEWLRREIREGRVDVELCYCSVYDECWTTSIQNLFQRGRRVAETPENRRVESCAAAPRSAI